MTKVVVLWFVGSALGAVFNTKNTGPRYLRSLVLHNLTVAAGLEFLVNLYTFPLGIEILFVPVCFVLVATEVVAGNKPESADVKRVLGGCSSIIGVGLLVFSIAQTVVHFEQFATFEKLKEFGLPIILMMSFIPYLYVLRYVVVMQSTLNMIRFGMGDRGPLYRFARHRILGAVGLSLRRAELFEEHYRGDLWGATSEADVIRVLDEFCSALRIR